MIVIYVVVGLGVIANLTDDSSEPSVDAGATTTEAGSTDPTDSTGSTEAPTTTVAPTTTLPPTTTTTQPTTTTTAAPVPQPDPVEYGGSGAEVIEFGDELGWLRGSVAVFNYEVSGSGNNVIWALDETFETADLLVNTIGSESGSRFLGLDYEATGLEVDISGSWAFTITPLTKVQPTATADDFWVPLVDTTGTFPGAATEVVDWEGPSVIALKTESRVAEISVAGSGNVVMWVYSTLGDADLLVNEIDTFEGSVRLPDCSQGCWLDIAGTMTYSLSLRS